MSCPMMKYIDGNPHKLNWPCSSEHVYQRCLNCNTERFNAKRWSEHDVSYFSSPLTGDSFLFCKQCERIYLVAIKTLSAEEFDKWREAYLSMTYTSKK